MKTKHFRANLFLLLILGLLFNSCNPTPTVCNSLLEILTNCSSQNWKVTESNLILGDGSIGSIVTSEINEIWKFKVDETYTRTTVSGNNQFGYNTTNIWLGETETWDNSYVFSFTDNNNTLELMLEPSVARPGKRIKFVRQ
ncbi:MAG TPA: hypothetical protein VIK29_09270 [Paludibacter sp.]